MTNQRYNLQTFEDRLDAVEAAKKDDVAALIKGGTTDKWLLIKCPCGCGKQHNLNLMKSYKPCWSVEKHNETDFTVHPSINAKQCGAHFWIKNNTVEWC